MNKSKSIREYTAPALAGLFAGCVAFSQMVCALPGGSNVTRGSATVSSTASSVTVNQTSPRAVIEWNNYNLAAGESVTYNMASSYAVLNLIQGSASLINGSISGQGQIYLVNPNGITFGSNANVSGGSIIASTLMVDSDEFFNGGPLQFYSTSEKGAIELQKDATKSAYIRAASGGNVALLGHTVVNAGVIQAVPGKVVLAAGEAMTLDFDGSGLIQIEVTEALASRINNMEDAISNSGSIVSGHVVMEANVAANVFTNAVNHQGVIRALEINSEGGTVRLVGNGAAVTVADDAPIFATSYEKVENLPSGGTQPGGEDSGSSTPTINGYTVQSALANSGNLPSTEGTGATSNTSLGLYNIRSPGIRLPDDQLEEEF